MATKQISGPPAMEQSVTGYRQLSLTEVCEINDVKDVGVKVEEVLTKIEADPNHDKRWLAIARTQLQQGFMAAVRSVARPGTFA